LPVFERVLAEIGVRNVVWLLHTFALRQPFRTESSSHSSKKVVASISSSSTHSYRSSTMMTGLGDVLKSWDVVPHFKHGRFSSAELVSISYYQSHCH